MDEDVEDEEDDEEDDDEDDDEDSSFLGRPRLRFVFVDPVELSLTMSVKRTLRIVSVGGDCVGVGGYGGMVVDVGVVRSCEETAEVVVEETAEKFLSPVFEVVVLSSSSVLS